MSTKKAENIEARLEEERTRLGFEKKDIAHALGVVERSVTRWESGTPVGSDKLALLAALGFDVLYIVTGRRCTCGGGDEGGQPAWIPLPHNPDEKQLVAWWRGLPDPMRRPVAEVLRVLHGAAGGVESVPSEVGAKTLLSAPGE